jgi:hypothetical protein
MVNTVQPSEIPMRALVLAALCGLSLSMAGAAAAQERLVLKVKPRSWLDAGTAVPVGSMQNYMTTTQGWGDISRFGARGGDCCSLHARPATEHGFFMFETPIARND